MARLPHHPQRPTGGYARIVSPYRFQDRGEYEIRCNGGTLYDVHWSC